MFQKCINTSKLINYHSDGTKKPTSVLSVGRVEYEGEEALNRIGTWEFENIKEYGKRWKGFESN